MSVTQVAEEVTLTANFAAQLFFKGTKAGAKMKAYLDDEEYYSMLDVEPRCTRRVDGVYLMGNYEIEVVNSDLFKIVVHSNVPIQRAAQDLPQFLNDAGFELDYIEVNEDYLERVKNFVEVLLDG